MTGNDFTARKMSDAELSKKLGRYQTLERITLVLGLILAAAGAVSAFVRHDLILFAVLFFLGVGIIVFVCGFINAKKNLLLNSQLGDFMRNERLRAFGPSASNATMPIDMEFIKLSGLISAGWDECEISNFYEGAHGGKPFSAANAVLYRSVEERSGPNNDNWMTKTVTVFRGVVVRSADIRAEGFDICITDKMQEKPPSGDVADPAVFRERFFARTLDGRDASGLVTPQLAAMCSKLEAAASGRLCGLLISGGSASVMLNTGYRFLNVPPDIDLRDLNAFRREYAASIEKMGEIIDILHS